jgi:hypothetical protein
MLNALKPSHASDARISRWIVQLQLSRTAIPAAEWRADNGPGSINGTLTVWPNNRDETVEWTVHLATSVSFRDARQGYSRIAGHVVDHF